MNSSGLKKSLAELISDFTKETKVYPKEIRVNWVNIHDGTSKILNIDLVYEDKREYLD